MLWRKLVDATFTSTRTRAVLCATRRSARVEYRRLRRRAARHRPRRGAACCHSGALGYCCWLDPRDLTTLPRSFHAYRTRHPSPASRHLHSQLLLLPAGGTASGWKSTSSAPRVSWPASTMDPAMMLPIRRFSAIIKAHQIESYCRSFIARVAQERGGLVMRRACATSRSRAPRSAGHPSAGRQPTPPTPTPRGT